jgi:hypothetical protein
MNYVVQKGVTKGLMIPVALLLSLQVLSCQKSAKPAAEAPAAGPQTAVVQQSSQPPAGGPSGAPGAAAPGAAVPGAAATPRQSPSPPDTVGSAGSARQPAAQPDSKGITLQKEAPAAGQQPPLGSAATLMALGRERRILPEDFKIGPLGDRLIDKADEASALATAADFLAGLVAGKIEEKYFTPDSAKTLSDTLTYGLQQGYTPSTFRLGAAKNREDGEIAANVRLFGAEGTSEGEIYLARTGKTWLVSDLQLSLAQLSVKREKPKQKFFPSAYRWLLED